MCSQCTLALVAHIVLTIKQFKKSLCSLDESPLLPSRVQPGGLPCSHLHGLLFMSLEISSSLSVFVLCGLICDGSAWTGANIHSVSSALEMLTPGLEQAPWHSAQQTPSGESALGALRSAGACAELGGLALRGDVFRVSDCSLSCCSWLQP